MKVQMILFPLIVALMLAGPPQISAYKVLFVMTIGTKSHINFFGGVLGPLAANGHQVTVVSPYKMELDSEKVKHIILREDYSEKLMPNKFEYSILKMALAFRKYVPEACVKAMTQPEVIDAMKEDYDAVLLSLFFTDCFLSYVHEKKVPLVYISPNAIMSPHSEKLGLPEFPSVSPNMVIPLTYPFSFWQRLSLVLIGSLTTQGSKFVTDKGIEKLCREMKLWSDETPSIDELHKQASLAIINCVRSLEVPVKSIPPTIIYAGGIHIKQPKPVSKELEDWFQGSGEHGFILFSLGTAVKPSQMKKEHLQSILNVFRSLKQRILWKWDSDTIEDLPPNVMLTSWLSQQDILAHPKIRLFITHGGLFSTQEATYFGVPVISMPIFGDQIFNAAQVVAEGWGRRILWDELTEEKFRDVIRETLSNSSIQEKVNYRAQLMKDWPINPSEDVSFWIEYVIRHKGAKHLQSPLVHLSWYQIYNVDVWLFIITAIVLLLIVLIISIRSCFRFCLKRCFKRKTE